MNAIHANAAYPSQTSTTSVLGLGAQAAYPMVYEGWRIVPQLRAGWDFALNQDQRSMSVGLSERLFLPEAYVSGQVGVRNQSGFRGGAGVQFRRGAMSFLLDYDVRTFSNNGGNSQALNVSLGYSF